MSVLTKGLAMDFVREGKKDMAITSIWPASVGIYPSCARRRTLTFPQSVQSAATARSVALDPSIEKDLRKPVSCLPFLAHNCVETITGNLF